MLVLTVLADQVDYPGLLRKVGKPGLAETVEKLSPSTQGTLAAGAVRLLGEPVRQSLQKILDDRRTGLRLASVTADVAGRDREALQLTATVEELNAAVLLQAFLPELMTAAEKREKLRFLAEFYRGDEAEVRRALWSGLDALAPERQEELVAGMIGSMGPAVAKMLERELGKQGIGLHVISVLARV